MLYSEHGLHISLDELRRILERAENEAKYHNMQDRIFIEGGENPAIKQYSHYAECFPIDHTYTAKSK